MLTLATLGLVTAQQCVIDFDNFHYDFTSLALKQISIPTPARYDYTFTFCGAQTCGNQSSSLCQTNFASDANNLGTWNSADNWRGGIYEVSASIYGDSMWCAAPRTTNVTFKCVNGNPRFVSIVEPAACVFEAVIEVPLVVCAASPCCTTPTYSSTRLESDGSTSVMQADATSGNWFDSDFEGKGQSLLCSKDYGRCFTFTPTTCVTAAYRAAPSQCYGSTADWTFVKEGPLVSSGAVRQTAWRSRADGSYVVTMPLGAPGSCVGVSGNKIDTSFEFSLVPNGTFWSVPKSCIKQ